MRGWPSIETGAVKCATLLLTGTKNKSVMEWPSAAFIDPTFLTDDFWCGYNEMLAAGIVFVRGSKGAPYRTVAVFEDLYGNLCDLIELPYPIVVDSKAAGWR